MPSITLDPRIAFHCAQAGAIPRPAARGEAILPVHIAALAILAAVGLLANEFQFDAERMLYPACVTVSAMFVWILGSWYWLRRTLFEPYPLFIFSAGLFNAGQAFLEVFGMNDSGFYAAAYRPRF